MTRTLKYIRARIGILNLIAEQGVQVGEQLPTEKDLVEKFNVSSISIRRALSDLAQDGVIEKVQGRGSFLLKPVRSVPTQGFVTLLDIQRARSYNVLYELTGLQTRLEDLQFHLRYSPVLPSPGEHVLREVQGASAVFVTGLIDQAWIDFLEMLPLPIVVIGASPRPHDFPSATLNWRAASRMLVEHFQQQGLKRIGLVNGAADYYPSHDVLAGVVEATEKAGLHFDAEEHVLWPDEEHIFESYDAFMGTDRFDAVIVEPGQAHRVMNWHWNAQPTRSPVMGIAGELQQHTREPLHSHQGRIVKTVFPESVYSRAVNVFCQVLSQGSKAESVTLEPVLAID